MTKLAATKVGLSFRNVAGDRNCSPAHLVSQTVSLSLRERLGCIVEGGNHFLLPSDQILVVLGHAIQSTTESAPKFSCLGPILCLPVPTRNCICSALGTAQPLCRICITSPSCTI